TDCPGGGAQRFTFFDPVQGGEPDEAARSRDLVHHFVARIDASGAVHALHLSPITDIDARGADRNAITAINAIACLTHGTLCRPFRPPEVVPFLTPFIVVGHND